MDEINKIPAFHLDPDRALSLESFIQMDHLAVTDFDIPVALMMEQAGYHLARLCSMYANPGARILVAAGTGNNGGGGLVAARRLAAWGFDVSIALHGKALRALPEKQLHRALLFGVRQDVIEHPDVIVDAILGFSQRLPLSDVLDSEILHYNSVKAHRIALDLPTGWLPPETRHFFKADAVLCLAAPKKVLLPLEKSVRVMIADLGLPTGVYRAFGFTGPLPFGRDGIIEWKRH